MLLTSENGFNNPFFDDVISEAEIPFGVIENVPVFPGCENEDNKRACFIKNISNHINKNYNIELADKLGLVGEQKIMMKFIIDNKGDVTDVSARSPYNELTAEAIRVIKSLPKFTPGTVSGKDVKVPYSLPIKFVIKE